MTRFDEVQPFLRNPIAAVAMIAVAVLCGGSAFAMLSRGDLGLPALIMGVVGGLVALLMVFGRVRVEVHEDAIYAQVFPLTRRHRFQWSEIESCEARTYRPILEYGGWGVRWSRHGKAYNAYGKRGVQLHLTGGRRLLLGSQRADELAAVIRERLPR